MGNASGSQAAHRALRGLGLEGPHPGDDVGGPVLAQLGSLRLDNAMRAQITAVLSAGERPVTMDRARLERQMRELALDAAELVGIRPSTVKRHLADLRARSGLTTEQLIYAGRAEGWLVVPSLSQRSARPQRLRRGHAGCPGRRVEAGERADGEGGGQPPGDRQRRDDDEPAWLVAYAAAAAAPASTPTFRRRPTRRAPRRGTAARCGCGWPRAPAAARSPSGARGPTSA